MVNSSKKITSFQFIFQNTLSRNVILVQYVYSTVILIRRFFSVIPVSQQLRITLGRVISVLALSLPPRILVKGRIRRY
jgi:hypothetical protein